MSEKMEKTGDDKKELVKLNKSRKDSDMDGDDGDAMKFMNPLFTSTFLPPMLRRQYLRLMVKSLPAKSQKNVKALKKLQLENQELSVKFYQEVYALQRKYQELFDPIHDKRKKFVTGDVEPTDEEADWKSDEEEEEIPQKIKETYKFNFDENAKGIPNFWLTVFANTQLIKDLIQPHDEEALSKLTDVKVVYKDGEPTSYLIEFHFAQNSHFSNSILTKQYFLETALNPKEPLLFEGPEITKCIGCDINWHKGMNLTVKTIKKKQKHKARNAVRTVTKEVPIESFFNFFKTFNIPEDVTSIDVETQALLQTDYEIGHMLRDRVIQKAVLYYTGDVIDTDDEDDLDEEEEEEDDEEEEEEEEDDDDEEGGGGGKGGNTKVDKKKAPKGTANDCPQQ